MNLRCGMNPHQQPATATPIDLDRQPFRILHGDASYINILDAAGHGNSPEKPRQPWTSPPPLPSNTSHQPEQQPRAGSMP